MTIVEQDASGQAKSHRFDLHHTSRILRQDSIPAAQMCTHANRNPKVDREVRDDEVCEAEFVLGGPRSELLAALASKRDDDARLV
eukprot:7796873-Heterocapsa_arctica.AAC.1